VTPSRGVADAEGGRRDLRRQAVPTGQKSVGTIGLPPAVGGPERSERYQVVDGCPWNVGTAHDGEIRDGDDGAELLPERISVGIPGGGDMAERWIEAQTVVIMITA